MLLVEHEGPKGQAFLRGRPEPVWFSSARDALIFTRLPEEPRDVAAVYVTDMAKAGSWGRPQPGSWVEVNDAWFVIGGDRRGGMGGPEAVPFSREDAARAFAAEHGGKVVRLADVPDAYLFDPGAPGEEGSETGHAAH
jgi:copper chaperone NosL